MTAQAPKPPPDHEQRRLIVAADTMKQNLIVEAAAGTGKTTEMINRMVALLAAGACRIETMVAVTFTRKAAAELQTRFQLALERAARDRADKSARQRLQQALDHFERCFIGTIHSFCARLLRERPVEAGVDAAFIELDEDADLQLRRESWEQFVARLYATDDPVLAKLEEVGLGVSQLRAAYVRFAGYPDADEWPTPEPSLPPVEPVAQALRALLDPLANAAADAGNDKLLQRAELLLRLIGARDPGRHADVAELLEHMREFEMKDLVQRQWPGGKEQAAEVLEKWNRFVRDQAAPFLLAWRAHRYALVMPLLHEAARFYELLRRENGALNFQDLLMLAARLLRQHPNVREYFQTKFSHVLVDEFQDTDPVQAEVLLLLSADDPAQRDWRRCRPVPGSLFVVGDPKQSIYRFRRADIVTYNEVKRIIIEHGGRLVQLTANFRATAPLIDWVNNTFNREEFFPKTADEFSPGYVPLQAGRAGAGDAGELQGVWRLDAPAQLGNQDAIAEREAAELAGYIGDALQRKTKPRVAAADFLIITRAKRRLRLYARALQQAGIPHVVTGGATLNEARPVWLLFTCLKAVTEPDNPVALVAVLRSELFGFSDQQLYAFRRAGGRFHFRAAVPAELDAPTRAAFSDAFDRLSRYAGWLAQLPAIAALERLIGDLGLASLAAIGPGGDVQASALFQTLELLRARRAALATHADWADWLGQLIEEQEEHDVLVSIAPPASAVRLMNLHQAKGLEAPVVFLADPSGESEHEVEIHIDRAGDKVRGYLAVRGESDPFGRAPLLAHPIDWERFAARERQFLDAESNRLLYVAATRAGTQLVISRRGQRPTANPWHKFADKLESCPELTTPVTAGPPAAPPGASVRETDVAGALDGIASRWAAAVAPTYDVQSAKSFGAAPAVLRAPASETGMQWGLVIHLLLQQAMSDPRSDLKALALTTLRAEGLDESLAEEAVQAVRRVAASDVWRRAGASRQRLTEVPIEVLLTNGGALPTILRGVIDLAFRERDGWVIVDYKTDAAGVGGLEQLVAKYAGQLRNYKSAWEQAVGEPVRETGLYFTSIDRYVTL
jgi:ATP-dependent helicase/nuclease subunit A